MFPKHRYEPWADVVENDRSYVEWLVGGQDNPPDLSDELRDYLMDLLEE